MWVSKLSKVPQPEDQYTGFNPSYSGCGLVSIIPALITAPGLLFQSFLFWMWVSKMERNTIHNYPSECFNPSYSGCGLVSDRSLLKNASLFLFQSFLFWMWVSKQRAKHGRSCGYDVSILLILDVG